MATRTAAIVLIIISIALFALITNGYAVEKTSPRIHNIGILPYYAPDKIWQLYSPLITYLNTTTGIKWELKLYHSYDSVIDGICSGEITIAYLGPNPFGLAYEKCRIKPLLVILGEDGNPFFRAIIITGDPDINSLKDLKGKKFAFGDKNATTPYIVPRELLEKEGISMNMIEPVFFKTHEKIVEAVLSGKVAAGATKQSVYNKFKNLNIKALKISPPLPSLTFCAAAAIDPEVEKQFRNALLKLKPASNPADKAVMKTWDPELAYGFAPPPDNYIENVLKLHNLLKKYKNEN